MRDRNLERNIKRLEAFIERWKEFGHFLDRGLQGMEITGEDEAVFLDLKSKIAQEHEVIMTLLEHQAQRDERALKLINLVPSLGAMREFAEGMPRKVTTDWHTIYMYLQAVLGQLKGRQAQLAGISSLQVGLQRVFSNPVMVVLIAICTGYGVYKFADEWFPHIINLMETKQ